MPPVIDQGTPPDLEALKQIATQSKIEKKAEVPVIRAMQLEESALAFGAQGGLAWRAARINAELARLENRLDQVFNFNPLVMKGNVIPPVIVAGEDAVKAESDGQTLRIADQQFKIESEARFVTVVPTWRSYLKIDTLTKPEIPHASVLPKDGAEKDLWEAKLKEGWTSGVAQADAIFKTNLARLKRDFEGMIRYRKLLAMNMVSEPMVASSNLGVTGDGKQIAIHDRVYRITINPSLETDTARWSAVVKKLSEK